MNINATSGSCKVCGEFLIQVNGVFQCILCASKRSVSGGLIAKGIDPGEEAMERLANGHDVPRIPGNVAVAPVKPVVAVKPIVSGDLNQALAILKALPMPKDIKQFKAINKAIKILEDLGA